MAIVKCPECKKEISNKAPSCPNCGVPIAIAADIEQAGTALTTIQETSKRFKIHIIISAILFWGGLIGIFVAISMAAKDGAGSQTPTYAPFLPILSLAIPVGFCWYVITKVRIWWHHK